MPATHPETTSGRSPKRAVSRPTSSSAGISRPAETPAPPGPHDVEAEALGHEQAHHRRRRRCWPRRRRRRRPRRARSPATGRQARWRPPGSPATTPRRSCTVVATLSAAITATAASSQCTPYPGGRWPGADRRSRRPRTPPGSATTCSARPPRASGGRTAGRTPRPPDRPGRPERRRPAASAVTSASTTASDAVSTPLASMGRTYSPRRSAQTGTTREATKPLAL